MTNLQVIEKAVFEENGDLDVFDVWYTIQGEGPCNGRPAVFVRLAGCNLQCVGCDTDYTSKRQKMSPASLKRWISHVADDRTDLIVITGGEPFRQNLIPLMKLLEKDYLVQIETNGTIWISRFPSDDVIIVCSPKTPKIHSQMEHGYSALKYIIEAGHVDPVDGLPTSVLGNPNIIPWRPEPDELKANRDFIYINPMDSLDPEINKANL